MPRFARGGFKPTLNLILGNQMRYTILTAILLFGHLPLYSSAGEDKSAPIDLGDGATSREGTLRGREIVDYAITTGDGKLVRITLESNTRSLYFNLLPPGSNEVAAFVGSRQGTVFEGMLTDQGAYTVRLYLMGAASDENQTATYSLEVDVPGAKPYQQSLSLQGVTFEVSVTAPDDNKMPDLVIQPSGLEIDNSAIRASLEGEVTGAEVADLNADGSPEVYVFTRSEDGSQTGGVLAWAANRKKSLNQIHLAKPGPDAIEMAGYRGGDEFAIIETILARRFPITGPNGEQKFRQLQYKLTEKEAGWLLELDRATEY